MENVKIIKYVDKQQQTKRTMSKLSTALCTYPQFFSYTNGISNLEMP